MLGAVPSTLLSCLRLQRCELHLLGSWPAGKSHHPQPCVRSGLRLRLTSLNLICLFLCVYVCACACVGHYVFPLTSYFALFWNSHVLSLVPLFLHFQCTNEPLPLDHPAASLLLFLPLSCSCSPHHDRRRIPSWLHCILEEWEANTNGGRVSVLPRPHSSPKTYYGVFPALLLPTPRTHLAQHPLQIVSITTPTPTCLLYLASPPARNICKWASPGYPLHRDTWTFSAQKK